MHCSRTADASCLALPTLLESHQPMAQRKRKKHSYADVAILGKPIRSGTLFGEHPPELPATPHCKAWNQACPSQKQDNALSQPLQKLLVAATCGLKVKLMLHALD